MSKTKLGRNPFKSSGTDKPKRGNRTRKKEDAIKALKLLLELWLPKLARYKVAKAALKYISKRLKSGRPS